VNPGKKGGGGGEQHKRGGTDRGLIANRTQTGLSPVTAPQYLTIGNVDAHSRRGGACLRRELAVRLKSMSSRRLSRMQVGPRYAAWQSVRAMQPNNDARRVVGLGGEQQLTG
jgi:hypothetical protein